MSRIPTNSIPDSLEDCRSALRGEKLPSNIHGKTERASIVRGIRLSHSFAISDEVTQLCAEDPLFQRARNARLIMSNTIPKLDTMGTSDATTQPYCIWHPDFATEDTYRLLAITYPSMRYQVGRACAAAGFASLYSELDLLPDVSIAEEARESETEGGRIIFDKIMASSVRYAIMDDFSLSVNIKDPRCPAFLNGDTAVRWMLNVRQAISPIGYPLRAISPDIEEDMRINLEYTYRSEKHEYLTADEAQLLYSPLPQDLPTVKKDLLINMAAYDGNIDRYARLSRPAGIDHIELLCILRGIYHHTMFARWWAAELESGSLRARALALNQQAAVQRIKKAITARRIMINDTQEFEKEDPLIGPEHGLPTLFWWPKKPQEQTLLFLAEHSPPNMKEHIAIASIVCDYQSLYKYLKPTPTILLYLAAENSPIAFYREDLEQRAVELGIEDFKSKHPGWDGETDILDKDLEPTELTIWARLREHHISKRTGNGLDIGPYNGQSTEGVGEVERYVWASQELLRKIDVFSDGWTDGDTDWLREKTLPE